MTAKTTPKTKKPPAGLTKKDIAKLTEPNFKTGISTKGRKVKILPKVRSPVPKISRMRAMTQIAQVYPIPFPTPSKRESTTPLSLAKASALPKTMQLPTNKERKTPKEL